MTRPTAASRDQHPMTSAPEMMASFPLGGIDEGGRFEFATGNSSVREVIWCLLATRPGERLHASQFGVGLHGYLHLPNTETTRALIREGIERNIRRYEPRIALKELIVEANPTEPAVIDIRIHYRLLSDDLVQTMEFSLGLE